MDIGINKNLIPIITVSILRVQIVQSLITGQRVLAMERLWRLKERSIN
jgi:hypothetical protein